MRLLHHSEYTNEKIARSEVTTRKLTEEDLAKLDAAKERRMDSPDGLSLKWMRQELLGSRGRWNG